MVFRTLLLIDSNRVTKTTILTQYSILLTYSYYDYLSFVDLWQAHVSPPP